MDILLATEIDDENPVISDIKLTNGQITLTPTLAIAVAQRISIRLRYFLGEWFLNRKEGFPWFQNVFIKNPDVPSIKRLIAKIVSETPGVQSILAMEIVYDEEERNLSIPTLDVQTVDGETVSAENIGAFIAEV